MFGLDGSELVVIAVVALVVIGPKDMPRVLRMVGQWVAKARGMTRHVRAGFDTMMREAELDEMQKQWDAQNAAIMASTKFDLPSLTPDLPPSTVIGDAQMLPAPSPAEPVDIAPEKPAVSLDKPAAETPAMATETLVPDLPGPRA